MTPAGLYGMDDRTVQFWLSMRFVQWLLIRMIEYEK